MRKGLLLVGGLVVAIAAASGVVRAATADERRPATVPVTRPFEAPGAPHSVYRLNAGGPAVTDAIGRRWEADAYYLGGAPHSITRAIAGTDDQALFRSERWGMAGYDIPIANGDYTLQLLMAELNPRSGRRVFSASANGRALLSDFVIADAVGTYRSLVRQFPVRVTDGVLRLRFSATSNSASVTGIELLSTSDVTVPSASP